MNIRHWVSGIRFYIAIGIGLLTILAAWWAWAVYGSEELAYIRLQQVYAWTSVALLFAAIAIGPMLRLFPRLPLPGLYRDARRMLGIGAAWFGLVHALLTYGVTFNFANPFSLADVYQRSLLLGVGALIILLAMAFTSFDKAFFGMGKWWFRLHRLVYAAVLFAVLHAFMVGSHATDVFTLVLIGAAALGLASMHVVLLFKNQARSKLQVITLTYAILFAVAIFNYGLTQRLGYNPVLPSHEETHQHED